jgi:hypothetical protein
LANDPVCVNITKKLARSFKGILPDLLIKHGAKQYFFHHTSVTLSALLGYVGVVETWVG